jgi:deazaflavin-dependent oxidoreductase (nitroreductase family)
VAIPNNEQFIAYNKGVIAEFRANRGIVTQPDFPVLLLTTTGARTGKRITVPLGFGVDEERVFVVASKRGSPSHPDWFHNLTANPTVTVELGPEIFEATALPIDGAERDRLFAILAAVTQPLKGYQEDAKRVFPIVVLEGVRRHT